MNKTLNQLVQISENISEGIFTGISNHFHKKHKRMNRKELRWNEEKGRRRRSDWSYQKSIKAKVNKQAVICGDNEIKQASKTS